MSNKLDQIQIPTPCPTDWEEMEGNDRMRYCTGCRKNVYNFSKITRREAEALIETKRGKLCARIVRSPDGTVMTEEATSFRSTTRHVSPVASAVVTAILTISSSAVAQSPLVSTKPVPALAQESGDRKPEIKPATEDGITSIAGTVNDQTGAVIAMATVKLTNKQTGEERLMQTSDVGEYQFTLIDAGSYSLKTEALGFMTSQYQTITVQQGSDHRIDVTMVVGAVGGGLIVSPTLPLRSLYEKSELIVVARVGKSVKVETEGEARLMKTQLQISSMLKGTKSERAVYVYHMVYGEEDETYVSGDSLLLFLNRRTEEAGKKALGGYEPIDSQYGVKKLSEADLQVYLKRIDELATMMSKEEPDASEIVEWLVRCAEDPATRWEGVYELERSAESLAESDDSTEEMKAPVDASEGETAEEGVEEEIVEEGVVEEGATEIEPKTEASSESLFAALLTAAQKERLSQALFNAQTITEQDMQLIALVERWDDGRLVPFLLSHLRRMEANPPHLAEEIIGAISSALGNEEITEFFEKYSENVSYEDEEETEQEGEEDEASEDAAESKTGPAEARRNRSEMLREFITLVESKMKKRGATLILQTDN